VQLPISEWSTLLESIPADHRLIHCYQLLHFAVGNHHSVWFISRSESSSPRRFLGITHSFKVTTERLKCFEHSFPAINFSKLSGGGPPRPPVGFAPSAVADFNQVLSGKHARAPKNRFHPVRLWLPFFILGEKRKLRSTRTLGTPVSVVQIIQVSCRAIWIETNRPQSLTAATQNCSSSSLLSYTKIWWRYTQRNKSLIKIWFLPPLDVDEWRRISVVSRHHNTHIVFVPRLFWDTLRLKENGILKWKKFRRYIDVGWST